MMKKIVILLVSSIVYFGGCSQSENKLVNTFPNNQKMNDSLITSENFVEKVSQKLQRFDKEPIWFYFIHNRSSYEIYTNDLPTQKYYGDGGLANRIEFNKSILKSGKQEFRLRIFPENEEIVESFNFIIKIGFYDKENPQLENQTITETINFKKSDFKKVGENMYESIYVFEAEVPYENEGWSKGQDLTKFDQKELENAVLAFYQKMWNIYNDKSKIEEQFPLIFKREIESAQSQYFDKNILQENLEIYKLPYTLDSYELQPIENYRMVIYGRGKMVALEQNSLDNRLRGKYAVWAKFKFNGEKSIRTQFHYLNLYLPQGKSLEDGLEIIR